MPMGFLPKSSLSVSVQMANHRANTQWTPIWQPIMDLSPPNVVAIALPLNGNPKVPTYQINCTHNGMYLTLLTLPYLAWLHAESLELYSWTVLHSLPSDAVLPTQLGNLPPNGWRVSMTWSTPRRQSTYHRSTQTKGTDSHHYLHSTHKKTSSMPTLTALNALASYLEPTTSP